MVYTNGILLSFTFLIDILSGSNVVVLIRGHSYMYMSSRLELRFYIIQISFCVRLQSY
jgi:hypothetical protein